MQAFRGCLTWDPSPRSPSPAPRDDDDSDWELVPSFSTAPPSLTSPSSHLPPPSKPVEKTIAKQDTFEVATLSGMSESTSASAPAASAVASPSAVAVATHSRTIIMPGWKDEYLTSLLEVERSSPVNFELVDACKLSAATAIIQLTLLFSRLSNGQQTSQCLISTTE